MTQETSIKIKAYMAGPDVFFANAIENAVIVRDLCNKYGIEALIPLDNEVPHTNEKAKISEDIFTKNVNLLESADIVIANLSPFRGPSADVGTVWEIGFGYAQKKPIYAFTNDNREYKYRVMPDGMAIEDFGNIDNTMIDKSIISIMNSLEDILKSEIFQNKIEEMRKLKKNETIIEKKSLPDYIKNKLADHPSQFDEVIIDDKNSKKIEPTIDLNYKTTKELADSIFSKMDNEKQSNKPKIAKPKNA